MEALWVVRATSGLFFVMKGSKLVGQDEAGVCCVWVQGHRSCVNQSNYYRDSNIKDKKLFTFFFFPGIVNNVDSL